MRVCPKCKERELDVTGKEVPKGNLIFQCWNCGFKISLKKLERIQEEENKY